MDHQFARDVLEGLSGKPKKLSSKYFYDAQGSKLFEQIMQLKEYYPTDCEYEVFATQKDRILSLLSKDVVEFELIEFGAGDGFKTKVLLDHFLQEEAQFKYVPVDISKTAVEELTKALQVRFPALNVAPVHDDYFNALETLNTTEIERKVVMFLGANIGNYNKEDAISFLSSIRKNLEPQDYLMIGFDLRKDPEIILNAYDDPYGVTAAFNLNLLTRINKELGSNFDVSKFGHYPMYEPVSGEARSFLVSKATQQVYIEAIDETIHFDQWEYIHTEISKKYGLDEMAELAEAAGFEVADNFFDCKHYFVDSIWRPV